MTLRRAQAVALLALAGLAPWSIAGIQLAAGALALACLASGDLARASGARAPVLAFAGWCALTVLLAEPALGTFELSAWKPALLAWVAAAAGLALGPNTIRQATYLWLAAACLPALWSLVQAFTGWDLLHLLHLRRTPFVFPQLTWPGHWAATGFFNSRLTWAHALPLPLGLGAALALRGTGRARLLGALASGLLVVALVLTFGRAGWWGALVLAVTLVVLTRSWALVAAGALAVALALAVPQVRARLVSSVSTSKNEDRLFIWARAREVIADHPVLGVGFGAYPRAAAAYYDRADPAFPMHTWCHDTPLSLLAETGPAGLALYVALWLSLYALGWPAVRARDPAALGLLAGTLGVHVASLFHDVLFDGEVAFALYLGGGLLAALGEAAARPESAAR